MDWLTLIDEKLIYLFFIASNLYRAKRYKDISYIHSYSTCKYWTGFLSTK